MIIVQILNVAVIFHILKKLKKVDLILNASANPNFTLKDKLTQTF